MVCELCDYYKAVDKSKIYKEMEEIVIFEVNENLIIGMEKEHKKVIEAGKMSGLLKIMMQVCMINKRNCTFNIRQADCFNEHYGIFVTVIKPPEEKIKDVENKSS